MTRTETLFTHASLRVWQRVLHQAFVDLNPGKVAPEEQRAHEAACEWFTHAGPDFREVCSLAGFDHEYIREVGMEIMNA